MYEISDEVLNLFSSSIRFSYLAADDGLLCCNYGGCTVNIYSAETLGEVDAFTLQEVPTDKYEFEEHCKDYIRYLQGQEDN